ncbi:hypothetical protein ACHAWF_010680 [Thalassiosira exigua]
MMASKPKDKGTDHYAKGSAELATESALLLKKLSHRLELTQDTDRLVVVLIGLPGRGKSFLSRKLQNLLQWLGHDCKIFNVGKYRRQIEEGKGAGADFFDSKNANAAALRQEVARVALEDMLRWVDNPFEDSHANGEVDCGVIKRPAPKGRMRVGIFDATNSTKERRDWVLEECTDEAKRDGKPPGVIFIKSICDDADIMRENFLTKVSKSPDYADMSVEDALADIMNRSKKYEEAYETIEVDGISYIKIFNLSSKIMLNHIYGLFAKSIVPALMSWNIGTRPIYLCRTAADTPKKEHQTPTRQRQTLVLSKRESLDSVGVSFKDALRQFMRKECMDFAHRREMETKPIRPPNGAFFNGAASENRIEYILAEISDKDDRLFACHIATSTLPRTCETVASDGMPSKELFNFNPLDKGEFTGMPMAEVEEADPEWCESYVSDPSFTRRLNHPPKMPIACALRFPGGECQADLMLRLEPMIVCLEQQVDPVLIVTHTSVLQALVAYFRNSDVEKCLDVDLPLNTVFKFTPAKGGGWLETQHCILPEKNQGLETLAEE